MHRQRGEIILASAEREAKSLHARIKKLDFKLTIGDWTGLPDQLVQTLFGHRADALFVNVNSVRRAWRLSIDQHPEFHGRSWRRGTHNEMKVARVKTVRDATVGLVQFDGVALYRPVSRQRLIVPA
jgi:hypothetical protein